MRKLIALDQALNVTGYSIFIDGSLSSYAKFSTDGGLDTPSKLKQIRDFIMELIDEENPDEIAIEEIQLQQIPGTSAHGNVETFKKLAYVQAIILEAVVEREVKYHIVPSASWKSSCGIRGKNRTEQKRNAQTYVLNEFGVSAIQDICDSICIGKHILLENSKEINWG